MHAVDNSKKKPKKTDISYLTFSLLRLYANMYVIGFQT